MRQRTLLVCLCLSGAAGLAYELLWTRLLALSFGSTTLSLSTVLAVYFGGVGLGAWFAGRRAATLASPVRTYAWLELGIALLAVALYPALKQIGSVFAVVGPSPALQIVLAMLVLVAPTLLLGATLPVALAGIAGDGGDADEWAAIVYGVNTIGAFTGAYLVTYHGLPSCGIFVSLSVAVGASLVAAIVAHRLSTTWEPRSPPGPRTTTEASSRSADSVRLVVLLAFLSGVVFTGFEIVWARLFSSFLGGTIYGVGAVLICFLVGMGIGSLVLARRIPSSEMIGIWFAALQTMAVASIVALTLKLDSFVFLLGSAGLMGPEGGSASSRHLQLLIVFVALAVPTAASGASFPLLVKAVIEKRYFASHALGALYGANTAGAIVGAFVAGLVFVPELGSDGTVGVLLALAALEGSLGGAYLSRGRTRAWGSAVGFAGILLLAGYQGVDSRLVITGPPRGETLDEFRARHAAGSERLAYFSEGRDATVGVFDWGDRRAVNINGLGQGSRAALPPHYNLESLLVGWIPYSITSEPRSALVVGLGAGVTVDWLLNVGVSRVSVAEIEPRVVEAVDVVFGGDGPTSDERVELVIGDARQLLLVKQHESPGFDIITSMPAHPWVTPSLYTREYFDLASRNLSERGVFTFWFGLWRVERAALESVVRAFVSVFPYYVIYYVPETEAYYFVGSERTLVMDRVSYVDVSGAEHAVLDDPFFLLSRIYATGDGDAPVPEGPMSTDDRVLFDRVPSRDPGAPLGLTHVLPHEYLLPAMVAPEARRTIFTELLERLLGSERGELPMGAQRAAPERAAHTLNAASEVFSEPERVYFRGRIALARGLLDQARADLRRASEHGGEIGRRAAKFIALTYPLRSRKRLESLLELPPTTDVLVELLEVDPDEARARVPELSPLPEEDPIGWFLYELAHEDTWKPGDRSVFIRDAGAPLLDTTRVGLLSEAAAFCRRHGMTSEAELLGEALKSATAKLASYFVAEGLAAGADGRLDDCARLLWEANELEPVNDRHVRPLLRALVATGDEARVEQVLEQLRFLGRSEATLAFLMDEARAGRVSFESPER